MADENKDYYTKALDEAKEREAFYQQTVQELRTEERYQNYFCQFTPASVESFIHHYAMKKVSWYQYGNMFKNLRKRKNEKWYQIALQFLIAIQRKKVYQAIIQWGNYQLVVPEARSFYDFNKWLCNPFACPYIKPVQLHEIETAVCFIHSQSEEKLKHQSHEYFTIQTLTLLEKIELDEYAYPLFFRYWDDEYSIQNQTKQPERVKKELAYVEAFEECKKQSEPPEPDTEPELQKPSFPYYHKDILEHFITACETADFKRLYKAKEWWENRRSFREFVEVELLDLSGSPRHLPIESHDDWREAIAQTAELYAREQVAEYLPLVYEEYINKLDAGDNFADWIKEDDFTEDNPWYPNYLTSILEGRKLMNEPADFTF